MSQLRTQLEAAKAEHVSATYPGDLGAEVLGAAGRSNPWRMRVLWLVPPAIAAMWVVALWPHPSSKPTGGPPPVVIGSTEPVIPVTPGPGTRPTLPDITTIRYETYVVQMRSGMEDAIGSLTTGVDTALQAPLVTESVHSVRRAAGELQEFANVTWSQIKPRPARGS